MNIDHSEFIARHHKTAENATVPLPQKSDMTGLLVVVMLAMFAGVLILMAFLQPMDQEVKYIAAVAFVLTCVVAFFIHRSYRRYMKNESKLDLINRVMEGSRGSRLITDSADNAIYTNKNFEHLCRGVGAPGFPTLVRLFQNNSEASTHFAKLADHAHRGLTDTIELFSKYEDMERWLSVTAQPIAGRAGFIHWRVDDVTEKYTTDLAIREEREKLIDFTDNAPVGFFSVNQHGRFIFANATFARWLGADLATLLSQGSLHTYLVEPPTGAEPYDLIADGRSRQIVELQMKGPAGKVFLASINQVVVKDEQTGHIRTRAVVNDLTAERQMHQALKASEDRFQRFFEEAPVGIMLVQDKQSDDAKDTIIVDCNNTLATMLQGSPTLIEGVKLETLLDEDARETALPIIAALQKGQQLEAPLELALHWDNDKGERIYVETQMHARRFRKDGNIVLHFIDLTEQKQLEAQFVQSQKMQAIGQLAGGVAHDFNNLLTAIIGFCDLLLLRHKPGDPSFGDIMQVKQNSNRAANLVGQLLAFSRQQTLRPRIHDLSEILSELTSLIRRLIGAGIELDIVHGGELKLVKIDETQFQQVFVNLAVNARDAMNNSGEITITTENFTIRKPLELLSEDLPPGHWVKITFADTGCGIPKSNLSRIFDPFFTTKDVGEGTGLGLSTVYGIIRQTGGYLDVRSALNKGTSFEIYLPAATDIDIEEDEAVHTPSEDDATKDLTGSERILLVEDEDAVRTFSQRALGNKGYEVVSANSGENALEVLEALENKDFDLVITDVVMPGMDGPTLVQRIRQESPNLKIIFMSGYTEDKLKDHMGEGIYFLPKPFSLKALAAKVKDVLAG